jgi:hypothetical protein
MPASPWFGIALLVLAAGALSLVAGLPARAVGVGDVPPQDSTRLARAITGCSPMVLA